MKGIGIPYNPPHLTIDGDCPPTPKSLAMTRKTVEILVDTNYGSSTIKFTVIEALSDNRYVLYAQGVVVVGTFIDGKWTLSNPIDVHAIDSYKLMD